METTEQITETLSADWRDKARDITQGVRHDSARNLFKNSGLAFATLAGAAAIATKYPQLAPYAVALATAIAGLKFHYDNRSLKNKFETEVKKEIAGRYPRASYVLEPLTNSFNKLRPLLKELDPRENMLVGILAIAAVIEPETALPLSAAVKFIKEAQFALNTGIKANLAQFRMDLG